MVLFELMQAPIPGLKMPMCMMG